MKYRVSELAGWFIIRPSGTAENNEPLRVRHLFRRWLAREGVKVIVDLHELKQFGVWGVGLLTSFKREVDQRGGTLRICRLNPLLKGYFQASCADGSSCATAIASGGQLGRALPAWLCMRPV